MNRLLCFILVAAMLPGVAHAWPALSGAEGGAGVREWQEAPPPGPSPSARPGRPGDRPPRTFERRLPGTFPPGRRMLLPPPWVLEGLKDAPPEEQERLLQNNPRFQEFPKERQEELIESLRRFQQLPKERQEELLGRLRRFQELPPERREELRDRMRRFREMPPEERERVERRFDNFRRLTPEQREKAREIYSRHWRSLPPERRRALIEEFRHLRTLSPEERERRLAAPEIAGHFNPEELALLKELSTL